MSDIFTDEIKRVKIWNTIFRQARREAILSKKTLYPGWKAKRHTFKGGTLGSKELRSLALMTWLLLALEAREGHQTDLGALA
jgi:hypothetical protein